MIANNYTVTYSVLSAISLSLGLAAAYKGYRIQKEWNIESSAEKQYELEKQVYLPITLVVVGFYLRLFLIPLWFLTLSSLIPSIPGAMCLTGVHEAGKPYSYIATSLKFVLPPIYGFWLALNGIDRKIVNSPFMRTKMLFLIPIICFIITETAFDLRFLLGIHPRQVSCCTSVFDMPDSSVLEYFAHQTWSWFLLFNAASILILISVLRHVRLPHKTNSCSNARISNVELVTVLILSVAALCAFVLGLHTKVGPMLLETPFHHCVFCLLQNVLTAPIFTLLTMTGIWLTVIYILNIQLLRRKDRLPGGLAHLKWFRTWIIICLGTGLLMLDFHILMKWLF